MPRIIEHKSSGTWWKVLLGIFLGIIIGIAGVVGGVAAAAAFVKTGDIINLTGADANNILTETYQNKTVLDIVMDAVGGNIKIESLGDVAEITPMIDTYVTNLSEQLDDLGCELTKEEIYSWPLTKLSDNLIDSVKKVELVHFLSKGKTDNPDPIVKYICYQTDSNGDYIKDENGNLVGHTLADMLDNGSFLQTKIDTMKIGTLFTEQEINDSSILKEIKDKTVKDFSKNNAFDDIKVGNLAPNNNSKIISALRRDEVTLGGIGTGVNNLFLEDVFEYNSYDALPAVLKKLLGKEAYTALPGELVEANPFTIHKMVFGGDGYPTDYDYIVISDGTFTEGTTTENRSVTRLANKTDYLKITDIKDSVEHGFYDKTDITVTAKDEGTGLWGASYSGVYAGTDRTANAETFTMNINKPSSWEHVYVYCCNKPARVKDLDSSIDGLTIKDVMKLKPADALWKVRNEPVKDGGGLFTSIKQNLVITDIIDVSTVKFLNKLENPDTITIEHIGDAINDLKLISAFEENIFSEAGGDLNTKWKYLLIEADEPWIEGQPNKSADPFNTAEFKKDPSERDPLKHIYKCNEYTLSGDGKGSNPKGIDQMITNMQAHMQLDPMRQLHEDGIITLSNTTFFTKEIPLSVKTAYPAETDGCDYYGDLSFTNFVKIMTAYIPTT